MPTIKDTLKAIRLTGCTASYDHGAKEFRINLPNGGEASACYTNNAADAVGTAREMFKRWVNEPSSRPSGQTDSGVPHDFVHEEEHPGHCRCGAPLGAAIHDNGELMEKQVESFQEAIWGGPNMGIGWERAFREMAEMLNTMAHNHPGSATGSQIRERLLGLEQLARDLDIQTGEWLES